MGSEAESEPSSTPKLPLFSISPKPSPDPSGMLTPPLQTSASVPFRWEEEPGKPRPCTTLITIPNPKSLELPPRLVAMEITKMPSPTTVLDGPYVGKKQPVFSSFRFSTESPERGQIGKLVPEKKFGGQKEKGILGSWGQRVKGGKKEVGGGSFVFSSSPSIDVEGFGGDDSGNSNSDSGKVKKMGRRMRRNGSFSSLSQARSHLWVCIYVFFFIYFLTFLCFY